MLKRRFPILVRPLLLVGICAAFPIWALAQGSGSDDGLYTLGTLGTFAGSSGAVILLYNTFRALLKRESLWVAFGLSLLVSYIVAVSLDSWSGELEDYFLAFLNGCLLFSSASGTQELIAQRPPAAQPPVVSNQDQDASGSAPEARSLPPVAQQAPPPTLRSSWFH